jgi:hypothetical protein
MNNNKEINKLIFDFINKGSTGVSAPVFSPNWMKEIFERKSNHFPKNPALQEIHMDSSGTMYIFENQSWQEIEDIRLF